LDQIKQSILIIDDDAGISKAFSRILQKNGYTTDTAGTGKEAIEKVTKHIYAAALIDVCLPDLSGASLASKLEQLNDKMIKIVITGFPIGVTKTDADAYLVKPVNPEKLLATLKEKLNFQT
jgi:DNA-binding NtrC family response regulator